MRSRRPEHQPPCRRSSLAAHMTEVGAASPDSAREAGTHSGSLDTAGASAVLTHSVPTCRSRPLWIHGWPGQGGRTRPPHRSALGLALE